MLAPVKVEHTRRLLIEGRLSQRKIAKLLGVSRATVSAIASGKRPDYEARRRSQDGEVEPPGPLQRCPGCGGMVYTPCRLCRVRRLKAQEEQAAKAFRRRARELAFKRLLAAVWKANHQGDTAGNGRLDGATSARPYLPPAAGGASDCK